MAVVAPRTDGKLFPAVDQWTFVWSGVAAASLLGVYAGRHFQPRSLVLEVPVGAMTLLTWYLVLILHPQMRDARQQLQQPEFQGTVHREKFQFAFNRLHRASARVHAVVLFLGWLVLGLAPKFLAHAAGH